MNIRILAGMAAALCLAACPDPVMDDSPPLAPGPAAGPSDTAFWFGEIYNLIDDSGSPARRSYIRAAVNAKWDVNLQPEEPGEESGAADCAFLLNIIDQANRAKGGRTAFGASAYATDRIVDVNTVLRTLDALYAPEGRFLALALGSGEAAWSADGVVWTKTLLPGERNWQCAAYGNGAFVALAKNNAKVAWSINGGVSWREADLPLGRPWTSVVYGRDKFVAFAENTSRASWSANGINWTDITLPRSAEWHALAWGALGGAVGGDGGGKEWFVALARSYGRAAWSVDGLTWTDATMPSAADWYSLAYGDGVFLALDYESNKTAKSTDGGKTWSFAGDLPSGMKHCGIAFGRVSTDGLIAKGMFVAVPDVDGNKAAWSRNGDTWNELTLPASGRWNGVAFGKGRFAAGRFAALALVDGDVLYSLGDTYDTSDAASWKVADGALPDLSGKTASRWQAVIFGH